MPPTVEKMGIAVRIFPLVQFGKIGKAVGVVFACVWGVRNFHLASTWEMRVCRLPGYQKF